MRNMVKHIGLIGLFSIIMGCQDLTDEMVGKKPEDVKTINITMVAKSAANPVFNSARLGAEAAAADLTDKHSMITVNISWRTPMEENAEQQAERILNAVEDGTDAIIVSCSDDSVLTAAINKAVDSGVPVMTFDSDAPTSKRFAFYGPNDMEIGEKVMSELVAVMGTKGQVAILGGNPHAPNLQKRVKGLLKEAEKYPEIDIVGQFYHVENTAAAIAEMQRVSTEYPDLKGWAMVGGWPFFDNPLLDKIEPGKVKIVAVDALPMQLAYIEKGIVDVFLGQPTYRWGKESVEKIVDKIYLEKKVDEFNQMKLIRVWKDNLGGWARQLRAWGYLEIPEKYLRM